MFPSLGLPSFSSSRNHSHTSGAEHHHPRFAKETQHGKFTDARRAELRKIGRETIDATDRGYYEFMNQRIDIKAKVQESDHSTKFYGSDSTVSKWATSTPTDQSNRSNATHISILQITTIDAARLLHDTYERNASEASSISGVLNFASATKPGGGFINGAEAQEESIARSSSLYSALSTAEATKFYDLHKNESSKAFYSHGMVYSPKVVFFRDNDGLWTLPFEVDVLTCAAVNAGEVLKGANGQNNTGTMVNIEKEMKERMGRLLYLFERKGARNIVLGMFGTGVFRNDVATVTRIWAQLLILPNARFKNSFDRVIFAVTGDTTYNDFKSGFEAWEEPKPSSQKFGKLTRRNTVHA